MEPVLRNKEVVVTILEISCRIPLESDGDEVCLKVAGKRVWPMKSRFERMYVGGRCPVNIKVKGLFGDTTTIELWENNLIMPSIRLGTFELVGNEFDAEFTSDIKETAGSRARYAITWAVSRDRAK